MGTPSNLTGQTFGLLTVLTLTSAPELNKNHYWYLCQCTCGRDHVVRKDRLIHGLTTSCGCYRKEATRQRRTIHGGSQTSEYKSYTAMIHRCYNPKVNSYANYGGRGITVCERWLESFENFLADMGPKPRPEYSLDRLNPFLNYCKENCKWATPTEQNNNKRKHYLAAHGVPMPEIESWKPIDENFEF